MKSRFCHPDHVRKWKWDNVNFNLLIKIVLFTYLLFISQARPHTGHEQKRRLWLVCVLLSACGCYLFIFYNQEGSFVWEKAAVNKTEDCWIKKGSDRNCTIWYHPDCVFLPDHLNWCCSRAIIETHVSVTSSLSNSGGNQGHYTKSGHRVGGWALFIAMKAALWLF